jgi:hypothetical protein
VVFSLFVIYTLTSLFVAQMIGSNIAAVSITGLGFIVIIILMLLRSKSIRNYLTVKPITFKSLLFSKLSLRLIIFFVLSLVILIGLILSSLSYLGIDFSNTRLGGFGSTSEISSVTGRLALWSNFFIQFKYSPFFGHMNVDCLTTGCGSYVHSVFASLLTHTGLLGFLLFVSYLLLVTKELFRVNSSLQDEIFITTNIYKFCIVLFFLAILVLGVIGIFLTWIVLWFTFGLIKQ